jgi:LacI family transcriptional regulator
MSDKKQPIQFDREQGGPRYEGVMRAVWDAIHAGHYRPGERLPDTRTLSKQLSVSPVTAHRGLRELVRRGILQRVRGQGTFVSERFSPGAMSAGAARIAVVMREGAALSDYYHGAVIEGIKQGAQVLSVKLMLLRLGEELYEPCDGSIVIAPRADELEGIMRRPPSNRLLVLGARCNSGTLQWIDVDNMDLASRAVSHLSELGHRRIAYVGGTDEVSNSRDRWAGFRAAYQKLTDGQEPKWFVRSSGWRLGESGRQELLGLLMRAQRPTAIFAGGYYFALDCYAVAASVGLRIPQDLSIVGVDDPPSATYLSPPLTTMRQPLHELGVMGINTLARQLDAPPGEGTPQRLLTAELVVRGSTAVASEPSTSAAAS